MPRRIQLAAAQRAATDTPSDADLTPSAAPVPPAPMIPADLIASGEVEVLPVLDLAEGGE